MTRYLGIVKTCSRMCDRSAFRKQCGSGMKVRSHAGSVEDLASFFQLRCTHGMDRNPEECSCWTNLMAWPVARKQRFLIPCISAWDSFQDLGLVLCPQRCTTLLLQQHD